MSTYVYYVMDTLSKEPRAVLASEDQERAQTTYERLNEAQPGRYEVVPVVFPDGLP